MKRLLIALLLLISTSAYAADGTIADQTNLGERPATDDEFLIWDASAGAVKALTYDNLVDINNLDSWGGLTAAVAAQGTTVTMAYCDSAQTVSDDLSVPTTFIIVASQSCSLNPATSKTLTMNSMPIAGSYDIVGGDGTVTFAGSGIIDAAWNSGTAGQAYITGKFGVGITPVFSLDVEVSSDALYVAKFKNTDDDNGRGVWIAAGSDSGDVSFLVQSYAASNLLYVDGAGSVYMAQYGNGDMTFTGATGLITTSSDEDEKDIIGELTDQEALDILMAYPTGKKYTWKDPAKGTGQQFGFISQEVNAVHPEAAPKTERITYEKESVEVDSDEAVKAFDVIATVTTQETETKKRVNKSTGAVEEYQKPVKVKFTYKEKRVKDGFRLDEDTGKFYREDTTEEVESQREQWGLYSRATVAVLVQTVQALKDIVCIEHLEHTLCQ